MGVGDLLEMAKAVDTLIVSVAGRRRYREMITGADVLRRSDRAAC